MRGVESYQDREKNMHTLRNALMLAYLFFGLGTRAIFASDLWISVLSHPPLPDRLAFGIYVHLPHQGQCRIELYEIINLNKKNRIAEYTAEISVAETDLVLRVSGEQTDLLKLVIDRSNSFATAPLTYTATLTLDPTVYTLTEYQASLSAALLNPAYPEISDQPMWDTNLVHHALEPERCPGRLKRKKS